MGGFNTSVYVGNPKAVSAQYTPSWDDQLCVACTAHTNIVNSDDVSARSSWSDFDRIIKAWMAQGSNTSYNGPNTLAAKLYDATASVTIYAVSFSSVALGASASTSGNPLATYTLTKNHAIKSTNNGSTSTAVSGVAFLFSSVPTGAATFDFYGSGNLLCDALFVVYNSEYQATAHDAVTASYVAQKTLQVWKIQLANASSNSLNQAVALSKADAFKIYDSTASVIIYTVTNSSTPASGTSSFIGAPLTTYTLPANNHISIDVSAWFSTIDINTDDILTVAVGMTCT